VKGDEPAHALKFVLDTDDADTDPLQANRFTPATPAELAPYQGKFHSPELGVTWSVALRADGNLVVSDNDPTPAIPVNGPLSPVFVDSFYGQAGYLRFTRDASGAVNGFNMSYNGMLDFRFER
jgi:hypothetical protein